MRWCALRGLIGIHEGPNEKPETSRREIDGALKDAFFCKKIASLISIPDHRLPVYEAAAQGIVYPYALPFAHIRV
jgi:hypothetical protein